MTEPRLLEGWKEIAEFMRLPCQSLRGQTRELQSLGIVFVRKITLPDKRRAKRVYAWSDKIRQWEMDKARDKFKAKILKRETIQNNNPETLSQVDSSQNTA